MFAPPARFFGIGVLVNKCLGDEAHIVIRRQRQDFGNSPPSAQQHVGFVAGDASEPSAEL